MRSPHTAGKLALLTLALAYLTGCGWEPRTDWVSPIFSDDDQGIAMVEQHLETQRNVVLHGSRTLTRYLEFQVHVGPVSEALSPVGAALPGQAQGLYYMRDAGYVLTARTQKARDDRTTWSIDRIDAETGAIRAVAANTVFPELDCDPNDGSAFGTPQGAVGIPSPEGALIAVVINDADCQGTETIVRFLDGQTLEPVGSDHRLYQDYDPRQGPGHPNLAWLPDGRFIVANDRLFFDARGVTAFTPGVGADALEEVSMDCFHPATTSSNTSADGARVESAREGDYALRPGQEGAFGCDL